MEGNKLKLILEVFEPTLNLYQVVKDFGGLLVGLIAAILTIFLALYQINKQHQNSLVAQKQQLLLNLEADKEKHKREIRIEVLKDLRHFITTNSELVLNSHSFCAVKKINLSEPDRVINNLEYLQLDNTFGSSLLAILLKVEANEIISANLFRTFRFALSSILHDFRQIQFANDRAWVLDQTIDLIDDAQMYIGDFQICLQNFAYGEIFGNTLSHRIPLDKRIRVITNDAKELSELTKYLLNETSWGINMNKIIRETELKFEESNRQIQANESEHDKG